MKVLIVDAQSHERENLIGLCECKKDLDVVGEAACGKAAIDAARNLNPDIMFLDVELPDTSGFDLLRAAACPHPLGIMVSNCADQSPAIQYYASFPCQRCPSATEGLRHRGPYT